VPPQAYIKVLGLPVWFI